MARAHESVAWAIEEHYRPLGPNDRVPTDPVAIAVALADKLDTLSAFWSINEKPTGSSDPYSLRRAALGLVRIVLANNLRIQINRMLRKADRVLSERDRGAPGHSPGTDVLAFLADRLKVQLREQKKRHDLVDAVFALGDDDLVRIVMRVDALTQFLATESGEHLLAGYKRAANILRAEERKDDELSTLLQSGELEKKLDAGLFCEAEERALHEALERAAPAAREAVEKEDFSGAMAALAKLRTPVDRFFDAVLVNDPDRKLRLNRLALLSRIRAALHAVADFSKIEG